MNLSQTLLLFFRENWADTIIPFTKLQVSIDGYQKNSEMFDEGTTALRTLKLTHNTSPISFAVAFIAERCWLRLKVITSDNACTIYN